MSLRIGIDARPALWPRTGIGTITENVIRRISAMDPANEYFFYFDADPSPLQDAIAPERMFMHPGRNELLWANTFLRRRLAQDRLDIVLSFLEKDIPFFSGHAKVICMVHDLIPLRFPDTSFRNKYHELYYKVLLRLATTHADLVLTNSEFSRGEILDVLKLPKSKVRRISLGVDVSTPETDSPANQAALAELGIHGDFLLAVGSTEPRKNNARVLRAFRTISGRFPGLKLVIVGKPWRNLQFDSDLITERVVLTGFVPNTLMPAIYKNAIALVFPSLHEGFGLPTLEAMMAGTPVITSRAGALPEVAGEDAIYVDAESEDSIAAAMTRVVSEPSFRSELSAKGQTRASRFRWDETCRELAASFRELGGNRQHNPGREFAEIPRSR